ncbi:hypothetical protein CDAR_509401 [Caerostris darwini]|uniref:Uncharacterized protein n=1 Tax=Caerostris darwini TaxID=1538125 RepID=A0AAV4UUM4_9ARAC|nr:hypothetical protein CDAR_509401 [Caerostris darwini]
MMITISSGPHQWKIDTTRGKSSRIHRWGCIPTQFSERKKFSENQDKCDIPEGYLGRYPNVFSPHLPEENEE